MGDSFFLLHNKKSMKPMSSAIVIVWPFASAATAAVASSLVESEAPMLMKPVRDGLRANSKQRNLDWTPPSYACSTSNCPTSTHLCLANPNHPQRTEDATCAPCQGSQTYWPCDVAGLCYCWDKSNGEKQIPPAPSTKSISDGGGLENSSLGNYEWKISDTDPCDIVTESVFKSLAPMALAPYTYHGFCEAVRLYNADHPTEGVFNMGNEWNQRIELAAFFGNALHESDEFKAGREYLMCADQTMKGGEMYCKPCDVGSFDWDTFKCSASLASEGRAFNSYCQSNLLPPDGCQCDDVFEDPDLLGYVKADQVYFGRGSIQLSWNYNYIRASVALTGAPQTFCQRPDLVATKEEYAWGAGLFYWMENVKNDKTCHQSVLMNSDFGETLDNINGGLECPADDEGWHSQAVQLRLNRYCRAATALGLQRLLSLTGCMDMDKKLEQCLEEGNCNDCMVFVDKVGLLEGGPSQNGFSGGNTEQPVSIEVEPDVENADSSEVAEAEPNENNQQDHSTATQKPTSKPTPQSSQQRTSKPTKLYSYTPRGPCSGEPCFIPPEIKNDPNSTLQFCRNAAGICGAGSAYCNAESTWTDFCHDCDADSSYGCPTFGCSDCKGASQICVGNLNSFNPISDGDCAACAKGQSYWPCDIQTAEGCWCHDTNLPRVEPAAPSGLELESKSQNSIEIGIGICGTLIDEDVYNTLAPNAAAPFTYQGFCEALDHYNSHHAEKIFRMGSYQQRLAELAAFLGMASHETSGFTASREYLSCGDNKIVNGELYCKPCASDDYNYDTHQCAVSMLAGDQSYMNFCQPYTAPPDGCNCEYVKQVEATGPLEGYMRANDIFFGRGSIQLSHNFNYIRASASMTGHDDTFCSQPEMLANVETYSWGVGMYLWMDKMSKEGLTSHVSVLRDGDWGGALNITNGGQECPVHEDDSFYSMAIINRIDHYCHAAKILGVPKLLSLDGCEGLRDVFTSCMADEGCPHCQYWHPDLSAVTSSTPPATETLLTTEAVDTTSTAEEMTSADTSNQPLNNQKPPDRLTKRPTRPPRTETLSTAEAVDTTSTSDTSNQPLNNQKPPDRSTKRPTRPPRTPPSKSSIPPPVEEGNNLSSQFASGITMHSNTFAESSDGENENENAVAETSQADSFAVISHSKLSNDSESTPSRTKAPTAPPSIRSASPTTESPVSNMASGFDEMNNWALTPLDVTDEPEATTSSTGISVDATINVQDIVFRPPSLTSTNEDALTADKITTSTTTIPMLDVTTSTATSKPEVGPSLGDVGTLMEMSASVEQEEAIASFETVPTQLSSDGFSTSDGTIIGATKEPTEQLASLPDEVEHSIGIISGRVCLTDENGEDVGMRGILVDVFECETDEWVEGTRTASEGHYIFEDLVEGSYHVRITKTRSYVFSNDEDSEVDSDGKSQCVEISLAHHSHSINAGMSSVEDESNSFAEITSETADASATDGMVDVLEENATDDMMDVPANCRGEPCSNGECRSKYSFCGSGEEYCNSDSQWTPDCPTIAPSWRPSPAPTTDQPTFVVDLHTQCSGEPCEADSVDWCRSELGFCGGGSLYCNTDSIWLPECTMIHPTNSPNQASNSSVITPEPGSLEPTSAPYNSMYDGWSSYKTPTLSEVLPNKNKHANSTLESVLVDNEELQSAVSDQNEEKGSNEVEPKATKQQNPFNSEWYDRYSYLDSVVKTSTATSIAGYTLVYKMFNLGMILLVIECII